MNDNKQPTNLNNTEVVNNDKREMKVENNNNSFIRFLKKICCSVNNSIFIVCHNWIIYWIFGFTYYKTRSS